ncbi:hypothetical protein PFISCL1PPCAC_8729, partial [Pristionchus fissidentatus]
HSRSIDNLSSLIYSSCEMRRDRMGSNASSSGSGDLHLDRLLPDFSFLRISLDHIALTAESAYLKNLQQKAAIFGYTLKYSFPCPDGVSSSLKAKVILRASSFSSNAIFFRHKRVNLVKLNADVIPFWSRASLVLELEVQLNLQGKYSSRPLARCTVPLEDLLLPPFAVSRDFDFLGAQFTGSALVKIDLGSQQRPLMERLERWRGEMDGGGAPLGAAGPDATFTVPAARHTRSRSGSRCRSRCSEGSEQENSNQRRVEGGGEEEDDDVFYDGPTTGAPVQIRGRRGVSPFRERNASMPSLHTIGRGGREEEHREVYARPVATTRRSSASSLTRDRASPLTRHALRIRLVVHSASGLPMARDHRGLLLAPSALISVRGRDGEMRSPVQPPSRSPHFDWACTFEVSGERRNVVVKLLHRDANGDDVPLGFVSLPLPTATVHEADYELVDLSGGTAGQDASTITLSVEACASSRPPSKLDSPFAAPTHPGVAPTHAYAGASAPPLSEYYNNGGGARTNSRSSAASSMALSGAGMAPLGDRPAPRRRSPSPDILILETREEIESRLRRNMTELDLLMSRLERR